MQRPGFLLCRLAKMLSGGYWASTFRAPWRDARGLARVGGPGAFTRAYYAHAGAAISDYGSLLAVENI